MLLYILASEHLFWAGKISGVPTEPNIETVPSGKLQALEVQMLKKTRAWFSGEDMKSFLLTE